MVEGSFISFNPVQHAKAPSSIPKVVLSFEDPSEDYDDIYMAKQFGINKLMAVVHPENHCVRYWMNKLKGYRLYQNEW